MIALCLVIHVLFACMHIISLALLVSVTMPTNEIVHMTSESTGSMFQPSCDIARNHRRRSERGHAPRLAKISMSMLNSGTEVPKIRELKNFQRRTK